MIREAQQNDLEQILNLYLDLHEKEIPSNNEHLRNTWQMAIKIARRFFAGLLVYKKHSFLGDGSLLRMFITPQYYCVFFISYINSRLCCRKYEDLSVLIIHLFY